MASPQTAPPSVEFMDGGKDIAKPFYQVDVNGIPISAANPSGTVAVADGTPATGVTQNGTALYNGSTYDRARTPGVFVPIAAVAITAGTPVAVWTPTAGKKFRLMGFCITSTVSGSILFKDAATEFLRVPVLAGAGQISPPIGNGYPSTTVVNPLNLDVTVTGVVSGFVYGTSE